ncbi:MAG: hypothetical protein KBI47_17310 [Armatimonadetes bacterium]|nr:hypothetical protein [Armatimonadota bacterium]MDI9586644.1 hypothetical protein [Acidobacteriota bacterium]
MVAEQTPGGRYAGFEYTCVCAGVHPRAGGICRGCRASEIGRNCWEMSISPCCDLPRDSCETCPIFAAGMRELARVEHVRVVMEGGSVIEGEICKRHGRRVSDVINDTARTHMAITHAVISHPQEPGRPNEEHEVVLVAKRSALLIYPVPED